MRNHNPIENTAMIRRRSDGAFLGSGVLYRYCTTVLTAEHVVSRIEAADLIVEFPGSRVRGRRFACRQKRGHPTADLSVLTIDPPDERGVTWLHTSFWDEGGYLGIDVMTYGFPQMFDGQDSLPTARLLKGYSQRFMDHRSHLGYRYHAMELSFGCPAGLSGAQLINLHLPGRLYGIITENFEAGTQLASISEVDDDGKTFRETTRNVINYGIALYLHPLTDWVDAMVPPVPTDEMDRRSHNQHSWRD